MCGSGRLGMRAKALGFKQFGMRAQVLGFGV